MEPQDQIVKSTKSAHGYLASPLSEHISEMPDGSLLVVGCPIARTGWQEYAVKDLPPESARELGIDTSDPNAQIDLYRPPEEVFRPEFLASLNGRPITDGHPPQFVNPDNFDEYSKGHIQNPRKGAQMEDGEWPIIADLVIGGEPLVSKVLDKRARDISLGYDFGIARAGNKIIQCDMLANHNAIVPKGRAGDLVAIGDQAAEPRAAPPEPEAVKLPGSGNGHAALTTHQPTKEKHQVKIPKLHIWGLGIRAAANDSELTPEELAQAAADIPTDDKRADDKRARDRKRTDDEDDEADDKRARDRRRTDDEADDKRADDKRADDKHARDRKRGRDFDPELEGIEADDRKRAHDVLDKLMGGKADDADLEGLRELLRAAFPKLDQFLGEEEAEPQHEADGVEVNPAELESILKEDDDAAEEDDSEPEEEEEEEEEKLEAEDGMCAHCGTTHDEEACPECGCRDKKADDTMLHAKDRATAHDGVRATLDLIRPAIAKLDKRDPAQRRVMDGFNSALGTLSRTSRARVADAGYGGFSAGARSRTKLPHHARATDSVASAEAANAQAQALYDAARTSRKGK